MKETQYTEPVKRMSSIESEGMMWYFKVTPAFYSPMECWCKTKVQALRMIEKLKKREKVELSNQKIKGRMKRNILGKAGAYES